jgi:hypothetical protein
MRDDQVQPPANASRRLTSYHEPATLVLIARVGMLYFLLDYIGLAIRSAAVSACYSRASRASRARRAR